MLFKELIHSVSLEELQNYINENIEIEFREDYLKMIDDLYSRDIVVDSKGLTLVVVPEKNIFSDDPDEIYSNVYGVDKTGEFFAITFTEWDVWLNMPVSEKSVKFYKPIPFIMHCLDEMSFISFDENEISLDFLKDIEKEIEDGTMKTYTMDEVLEDMKNNYGIVLPEKTEEEKEEERKKIKEIDEWNKKSRTLFLQS